jgi:hypothetical protein
MLNGRTKRKGGYAGDGGTIKAKPDFCAKALFHLSTFGDLTEEAKEIAKRIHALIASNNS